MNAAWGRLKRRDRWVTKIEFDTRGLSGRSFEILSRVQVRASYIFKNTSRVAWQHPHSLDPGGKPGAYIPSTDRPL